MIEASGAAGACHVLRLRAGEDVRQHLADWCVRHDVHAAIATGAVGSLSVARLRFGGRSEATTIGGDLELCSLSGTVSRQGQHLHVVVADNEGRVLGGHLCEGSIVRTTLEMSLLEVSGIRMDRALDPGTGHHELKLDPDQR